MDGIAGALLGEARLSLFICMTEWENVGGGRDKFPLNKISIIQPKVYHQMLFRYWMVCICKQARNLTPTTSKCDHLHHWDFQLLCYSDIHTTDAASTTTIWYPPLKLNWTKLNWITNTGSFQWCYWEFLSFKSWPPEERIYQEQALARSP